MLSYCLRALLAGLVLLCLVGGPAQAQTSGWTCQAPLCNPNSRHGMDVCVVQEAGGKQTIFGGGYSGGANVAAAVMYGSAVFIREHPGINWSCSPQLPAP